MLLVPFFSLIHLNDLSYSLSSTTRLYADDPSISSVVHDVTQSNTGLNDDLEKNSNLAYQ